MTVKLLCAVALCGVLTASCATAPAPPAPDPAPAVEAPPPPPPPPTASLFCGLPGLRRVALEDLGLPEGSRAVDVALTADTVWVLVEPATLVGFPRRAREVEELDVIAGQPGERWETLAVDPLDGSVWIASSGASYLRRKRPGRWIETVRVTPAPGKGGFRDLAVRRDGLWAATSDCADGAVWKLDRAGKQLRADFPAEGGSCRTVDLEEDWREEVWALRSGQLFQLAHSGAWEPVADGLAVPLPPDPTEVRWFFWGTEPKAVGPASEGGHPTLYRWESGAVAASFEDCGAGNPLLETVGDRRGWVVLTPGALLLGEYPLESPSETP